MVVDIFRQGVILLSIIVHQNTLQDFLGEGEQADSGSKLLEQTSAFFGIAAGTLKIDIDLAAI